MTTIKPEHLKGLVTAFKSSLAQGVIPLPVARDFCDECFNAVLDHTVATGKGAITTPVRFGGTPMTSEVSAENAAAEAMVPEPVSVEVALSPKAQEAKARAAAKRKVS